MYYLGDPEMDRIDKVIAEFRRSEMNRPYEPSYLEKEFAKQDQWAEEQIAKQEALKQQQEGFQWGDIPWSEVGKLSLVVAGLGSRYMDVKQQRQQAEQFARQKKQEEIEAERRLRQAKLKLTQARYVQTPSNFGLYVAILAGILAVGGLAVYLSRDKKGK